jgi:hypothetical protein
MADVLSERNVRVALRIFAGEGHGFRRAATIAASLEIELELFRSALVDARMRAAG